MPDPTVQGMVGGHPTTCPASGAQAPAFLGHGVQRCHLDAQRIRMSSFGRQAQKAHLWIPRWRWHSCPARLGHEGLLKSLTRSLLSPPPHREYQWLVFSLV